MVPIRFPGSEKLVPSPAGRRNRERGTPQAAFFFPSPPSSGRWGGEGKKNADHRCFGLSFFCIRRFRLRALTLVPRGQPQFLA